MGPRGILTVIARLSEILLRLGCRHEWIRERRENGRLGLRCMHCLKRKEHDMLRLIEWQIDYEPIEPAYPPAFPPPLQDTRTSAERRKKPKRAA
jgi:hypothetical protein